MSDHSALADRLTNLEMLFMHLEATVKELDGVVLAQQKALEALTARIALLTPPNAALNDDEMTGNMVANDPS